jgi:ABC-type branched-subunit amino acid transport system ATPase component
MLIILHADTMLSETNVPLIPDQTLHDVPHDHLDSSTTAKQVELQMQKFSASGQIALNAIRAQFEHYKHIPISETVRYCSIIIIWMVLLPLLTASLLCLLIQPLTALETPLAIQHMAICMLLITLGAMSILFLAIEMITVQQKKRNQNDLAAADLKAIMKMQYSDTAQLHMHGHKNIIKITENIVALNTQKNDHAVRMFIAQFLPVFLPLMLMVVYMLVALSFKFACSGTTVHNISQMRVQLGAYGVGIEGSMWKYAFRMVMSKLIDVPQKMTLMNLTLSIASLIIGLAVYILLYRAVIFVISMLTVVSMKPKTIEDIYHINLLDMSTKQLSGRTIVRFVRALIYAMVVCQIVVVLLETMIIFILPQFASLKVNKNSSVSRMFSQLIMASISDKNMFAELAYCNELCKQTLIFNSRDVWSDYDKALVYNLTNHMNSFKPDQQLQNDYTLHVNKVIDNIKSCLNADRIKVNAINKIEIVDENLTIDDHDTPQSKYTCGLSQKKHMIEFIVNTNGIPVLVINRPLLKILGVSSSVALVYIFVAILYKFNISFEEQFRMWTTIAAVAVQQAFEPVMQAALATIDKRPSIKNSYPDHKIQGFSVKLPNGIHYTSNAYNPDVGFTKRTLPVLNEVDVTLHNRDIVTLTGPSGSGKSTLSNRILNRVCVGTEGADQGSSYIEVPGAMVPSQYFDTQLLLENIVIAPQQFKASGKNWSLRQTYSYFGLSDVIELAVKFSNMLGLSGITMNELDREFESFSTGEKKSLLLGMALLTKIARSASASALIMYDETYGLGKETRSNFFRNIPYSGDLLIKAHLGNNYAYCNMDQNIIHLLADRATVLGVDHQAREKEDTLQLTQHWEITPQRTVNTTVFYKHQSCVVQSFSKPACVYKSSVSCLENTEAN